MLVLILVDLTRHGSLFIVTPDDPLHFRDLMPGVDDKPRNWRKKEFTPVEKNIAFSHSCETPHSSRKNQFFCEIREILLSRASARKKSGKWLQVVNFCYPQYHDCEIRIEQRWLGNDN